MSKHLPSIGVNLRVTGHCSKGQRKYMEDAFAVAYQQTNNQNDLEFAYFGIFDGHGGRDAAIFAKEHLMNAIVNQKSFWSGNDDDVLKSIKDGFVATHMAMWKEVGKWPQTVSGLPSTSGTTASVVFIRNGKLYVGHVGDSAVVLGYKNPDSKHYEARSLTSDHKPELPAERKRIEDGGGSVMSKCGVQRVVWNRPKIGHKGPIRRSTHIDQIPFLAVARSLGDLWSYDYLHSQFNVSPEPDVCVVSINIMTDRCIIVATDGVWNMISSRDAARYVEAAERENERHFLANDSIPIGSQPLINPSRLLVDKALALWFSRRKRADNATVLTIMLDPPGPPRSEVLLQKRMLYKLGPHEEISSDHSYSSAHLLNRSFSVIHSQPVNSMNQPFESERPIVNSRISSFACSTESYMVESKEQTNSVISSDYDIWMKGSLCLQRSGECKLVADTKSEEDQGREEMWRLAPTPPLPDKIEDNVAVASTFQPRYPLVRSSAICLRQSQFQPFVTANSIISDNGDSNLRQTAVCSSQSSYVDTVSKKEPKRSPANYSHKFSSDKDRDKSKKLETDPTTISSTSFKTSVPSSTTKLTKRLTRVKRKSVPGKRELYFLLAKQSRFGRNLVSPITLYNNTYTRHITRSRVRLRKSCS